MRRPFHDTVGLFYGRILFTDSIRNGSAPLWYTYARYSFPLFTLEGGMAWSPIGFLVGALAPYGLFSWAFEGLLWNLLCLGSTFLFARRHVESPFSAAAIAISYSSSGLMIASFPTIGTTRAFQIGPLAFLALDILASSKIWTGQTWARGTFILTLAGTLWLTSGYPGIWLTAPVLLLPYLLFSWQGGPAKFLIAVLACLTSAILSIGMCSLLVDGTFNSPFYGAPGVRPPVSPSDGALQLRNLANIFLANPAYLRDTNGGLEPLYLGASVTSGLILLRARLGTFSVPPPFRHLTKWAALAGTASLSIQGMITGATDAWSSIGFGLACIVLVSRAVRDFDRTDLALTVTTLLSVSLASQNFLGDLFRAHVPPFTIIRWNEWYLWTATLCLVTYSWRNIETWMINFFKKPFFVVDLYLLFWTIFSSVLLVFCGLSSILIGITMYAGPTPIDYGYIHLLTYYYLLICTVFTLITAIVSLVLIRQRPPTWPVLAGFWAILFTAIPIGAGLATVSSFTGSDDVHRIGSSVPPHLWLVLDFGQIVAYPIAAIYLFYYFRKYLNVTILLVITATLVASDMSFSSPRILSHAYFLRSGQVNAPLKPDRVFAFTGNNRKSSLDNMSSGSSMYNGFVKEPDQMLPGGAQPQMQLYDELKGSPSVFERFVHFPTHWTSAFSSSVNDTVTKGTAANFTDKTSGGNSSNSDETSQCEGRLLDSPVGTVTKLLPDETVLQVYTDCARLVVLMDTWAPGWTVSVDGKPTQSIRVNGVLRGVEVPAGDHTVTWFYRPVHWTLIVAATIGSLFATIALGLASIVLPSRQKALPI